MSECLHRKGHKAKVNVVYLEDVDRFVAEIGVICASCGKAFSFGGLPRGASTAQPMVSVDKTEVRLPMFPPEAQPKSEGERG